MKSYDCSKEKAYPLSRENFLALFPNATASTLRANGFLPNDPPSAMKMEIVKCATCGKEFNAQVTASRKYCSPKCAYADHARVASNPQSQLKDRGSRQCKQCGKVFRVHTRSPDASFCSRHCCALYKALHVLPGHRHVVNPTKRVTIKCAWCGKPFQSWPSAHRVYCSEECAFKVAPQKSAVTKHANGFFTSSKPYSRCLSGWREIGGRHIFARSSWEANYARYLQLLKEIQEIKEWEHEAQTFWFAKIKRGVRSYLPDFRVVQNDGSHEYHEVKGWMDKRSQTKLKRMAKYFPDIKIRVIDKAWFKANRARLSSIVPGWEKQQPSPSTKRSNL